MRRSFSPSALRLVRLPGEFGPILRCYGELSVATAEALRREVALLVPGTHAARGCGLRAITLNLSGCSFLDVDGILTVLDIHRELRRKGCRLLIVVGTGRIAGLLPFRGIARISPPFPTEEAAVRSLRAGEPLEPTGVSWAAARAETLACWRAFQQALGRLPADEAVRQLTSRTTLCMRSDEILQALPARGLWRCQFCPLFRALGGRPKDLGCQSVLDPIIQAVLTDDPESGRTQVARLICTLEAMPLPKEVGSVRAPG